jgi:hypothetical protein
MTPCGEVSAKDAPVRAACQAAEGAICGYGEGAVKWTLYRSDAKLAPRHPLNVIFGTVARSLSSAKLIPNPERRPQCAPEP